MNDKRILALDLGTKTGYVYKGSDSLSYGLVDTTPNRMESYGIRFKKFKEFLDTYKGRVDLIVFEEVRGHKGTHAAQIYGGFVAILTEWCESFDIPYQTVLVSDVKKRATGLGNAKKDLILYETKKRWPDLKVKDDNIADALWIMDLVCYKLGY